MLLIPREHPSEVLSQSQKAVRDADRHFHSGKFFLQEGKPGDARREFDLAVDVLLAVPESAPDRNLAEKKFEELIRLIHRYDVDSLGAGVSPENPVFVQSPLPEILDLTFPIDPRLKGKALAVVAAASSQLPLTVNDAVLSYINFFTSPRGKRVIEYGMKRSGRYRAMISRVLDEEGVPQELIHLAQAESGFAPRAVSYMAAAGMWQFVRSRGAEYGLAVTRLSDDRLDPEKATRAAARHLRDLYGQLGDWYLAMAAYNCGPYCVERAVQRTGYADFWELHSRRALPRDTMNYVPAILAMAIVCKNPRAYGIDLSSQDAPLEYDTIRMSAATSMALLADAADVAVSELRELNPGILKTAAPDGYEVRVPKDKGNSILAALESVPAGRRAAWRLHRVAEGDTLPLIARRYSAAPAAIVSANSRLDASFFDAPRSGELLIIPAVLRELPAPARRAAAARGAARGVAQKGSTARLATVSQNRRTSGR
ncbi:MAG: transglycosylase SLT domain-containing protein [Candidatus Solibacter usitatus]|nr:transglycosylase SLT domain-containing protein [Candidatus Solibacter usitatus]